MSEHFTISENDLHGAIGRLYDAAIDPIHLPAAFDHLASICGGMGITLFPRDPDGTAITYVSPAIQEAAAEYFTGWLDRCPRIAYSNRNPIFDRVFWDGDILDEDTIRSDPYFRDYARSHDLCYSMIRSTTGLNRSARYIFSSPLSLKSGVPGAAQIRAFEILSGHAVRALQVYRKLACTNPAEAGLEALMNHETHGVMIVNIFGNVVHANPVVVRLAGNGLSIQNRRAIAATLDGQKSLDALIRKTIWPTTEAPQQAPVALPRGPGRKPLLVQAIPLCAEQSAASGLLRANAGALVLVVDPETAGARTETETFRLLGLTATEAKIASILGTGSSPEAAADMLGLSVGTVRNHIKRVFSKLDISRQGQLVDLAGRLSVMTTGRH
jgi:DNA-binding CsgD family transcriptional regulator